MLQSTNSESDSIKILYSKEVTVASIPILINNIRKSLLRFLSTRNIIRKNATAKTIKNTIKRNQKGYRFLSMGCGLKIKLRQSLNVATKEEKKHPDHKENYQRSHQCNISVPGKSTTECYEYTKRFNLSHVFSDGPSPGELANMLRQSGIENSCVEQEEVNLLKVKRQIHKIITTIISKR